LAKCKDKSDAKMPFNSTNKYALSVIRQEGTDHHFVVYIKGAPEKVWKYCGRILYEGKYKPIDQEDRKKFDGVNLKFGKNGERVLGFAMLPLPKEQFP
jgi:sodium/potassium-transporting ATPase subunit alpha